MNSPVLDQPPSTSVCLFEVAGRVFGVEIREAREVRTIDRCTAVPLAPSHLIGMTSLRGAIVPVLDLRPMLGLPSRASARMVQSLVVEASAVRVALAIDSVIGIEPFDQTFGPTGVAVEAAGLDRGCLQRGDDAVPILDVVKIVDSLKGHAGAGLIANQEAG